MPKKNHIIRVDFRDEKTGALMGYTELPWEEIPGRFRSRSGLHVRGEAYTILSAEPEKQKEWIRLGKLTLTLESKNRTAVQTTPEKKPEVPVTPIVIPIEESPAAETVSPAEKEKVEEKKSEPVTVVKQDQPLVRKPEVTSIPREDTPAAQPQTFITRSGHLPKASGKTANPETIMVLMPSEWRQIELIGKDQRDFLDAEMKALREATDLWIRLAITQPLASLFTVDEFIRAVVPDAERLQGFCFQGSQEVAEGSFALRNPEGAEIYGTEVAGFIFALGFRRFPLPADTQRKLSAFMTDHNLVLVHWIRGRVLRASDLS